MVTKKCKEVGMKILVYDNQLAYFKLLKTNFNRSYNFILFDSNRMKEVDSEYGMVLFFVNDEIELLDFARLYREEIHLVLAISGRNRPIDFTMKGNIQYLNLDKLKDELISDVTMLLEKLV
jgi:hypothetical protein